MIVLMLSILDAVDIGSCEWGSYDHLRILAKVMQEVESLKEKCSGDIREEEELILKKQLQKFKKGTTHISVADELGNFVSMSLTNGEGSGYFVPGTGIMLNNMLGEDDLWPEDFSDMIGGTRINSMMSPCILEKDADHCIVTGSGGSKRIRSSLLQVISNLVDFQMDLERAVDAPRINWNGEALQLESGFSKTVINRLTKNFPVNEWPHKAFYFGGTHSVIPITQAHGDSRRGGKGKVVK